MRNRNAAPLINRSTEIDPSIDVRSTSVDLDVVLQLLRQAVSEKGHTLDSLAAHFKHVGCPKDRAYIGKVLNADKPLSYEFIVALPDDVEARFEQLRAERFGLIVVEPLSGVAAMKAAVAGLIGLMSAPQLPARTDRVAKVETLAPPARKEIA